MADTAVYSKWRDFTLLGLEMGRAEPLQGQRRGAYSFKSAIPTTASYIHQEPYPSQGRCTLTTTCSSIDKHTLVHAYTHTQHFMSLIPQSSSSSTTTDMHAIHDPHILNHSICIPTHDKTCTN